MHFIFDVRVYALILAIFRFFINIVSNFQLLHLQDGKHLSAQMPYKLLCLFVPIYHMKDWGKKQEKEDQREKHTHTCMQQTRKLAQESLLKVSFHTCKTHIFKCVGNVFGQFVADSQNQCGSKSCRVYRLHSGYFNLWAKMHSERPQKYCT